VRRKEVRLERRAVNEQLRVRPCGNVLLARAAGASREKKKVYPLNLASKGLDFPKNPSAGFFLGFEPRGFLKSAGQPWSTFGGLCTTLKEDLKIPSQWWPTLSNGRYLPSIQFVAGHRIRKVS
jgi:hypothetical protein